MLDHCTTPSSTNCAMAYDAEKQLLKTNKEYETTRGERAFDRTSKKLVVTSTSSNRSVSYEKVRGSTARIAELSKKGSRSWKRFR